MEFVSTNKINDAQRGQMATSDPRITLPQPNQQTTATPHGDPAELEAKFAIPELEPSRYLREKATGVIHAWSDAFGERSDLMENYTPSLAELLKFKESIVNLLAWQYTPEQLYNHGVSIRELAEALVPVEKLQELGAEDEELIELGFVPKAETKKPRAKAAPKAKPKPVVSDELPDLTPPPPPPAE